MDPDLPQKTAYPQRHPPRSIAFLRWRGFLLFFILVLLTPWVSLSEGAGLVETEAPLLDSVPGPGPAKQPEETVSGVKSVKRPPAETISPREREEEAALRKRARRAADRYTLSNKTLFDHILARHGPKSAVPGKSRFLKGFDVRAGIDFVLKSADARIRPNTDGLGNGSATRGRRGYIFEMTYHKKIGISPEKKPLKTLRVVIDEAGRVITAFPVK